MSGIFIIQPIMFKIIVLLVVKHLVALLKSVKQIKLMAQLKIVLGKMLNRV